MLLGVVLDHSPSPMEAGWPNASPVNQLALGILCFQVPSAGIPGGFRSWCMVCSSE